MLHLPKEFIPRNKGDKGIHVQLCSVSFHDFIIYL